MCVYTCFDWRTLIILCPFRWGNQIQEIFFELLFLELIYTLDLKSEKRSSL